MKKLCQQCGNACVRLDVYDAYACRACDLWWSTPCKHDDCVYCKELKKVEKPSSIPEEWDVWNDPWNT